MYHQAKGAVQTYGGIIISEDFKVWLSSRHTSWHVVNQHVDLLHWISHLEHGEVNEIKSEVMFGKSYIWYLQSKYGSRSKSWNFWHVYSLAVKLMSRSDVSYVRTCGDLTFCLSGLGNVGRPDRKYSVTHRLWWLIRLAGRERNCVTHQLFDRDCMLWDRVSAEKQ